MGPEVSDLAGGGRRRGGVGNPAPQRQQQRDHWPQANAAVIAGGGMKLGRVIGRTNKYAEMPADRPVKFQEVFATLYAKAGLNLNTREFDLRGRAAVPR